jgi:hypothetical protein
MPIPTSDARSGPIKEPSGKAGGQGCALLAVDPPVEREKMSDDQGEE